MRSICWSANDNAKAKSGIYRSFDSCFQHFYSILVTIYRTCASIRFSRRPQGMPHAFHFPDGNADSLVSTPGNRSSFHKQRARVAVLSIIPALSPPAPADPIADPIFPGEKTNLYRRAVNFRHVADHKAFGGLGLAVLQSPLPFPAPPKRHARGWVRWIKALHISL